MVVHACNQSTNQTDCSVTAAHFYIQKKKYQSMTAHTQEAKGFKFRDDIKRKDGKDG